MKLSRVLSAFAVLAVAAPLAVVAQTTSLNIGPAGYNCGFESSPVYCSGIPTVTRDASGNVTGNGTLWLDAQRVYSGGQWETGGFVMVNGVEHAITGPAPFVQQLTSSGGTLEYTFAGGSLSLTYTTYYSSGGGGRGGGGAGWRWVVTGGNLNLN